MPTLLASQSLESGRVPFGSLTIQTDQPEALRIPNLWAGYTRRDAASQYLTIIPTQVFSPDGECFGTRANQIALAE